MGNIQHLGDLIDPHKHLFVMCVILSFLFFFASLFTSFIFRVLLSILYIFV